MAVRQNHLHPANVITNLHDMACYEYYYAHNVVYYTTLSGNLTSPNSSSTSTQSRATETGLYGL